MSVYPIIWAIEHAPVVDAEERAILAALVTKGDFDGCNCYRSFASLARVACVDRRTAMRKVKAMTDRGLLREQIDPKPESWYRLPADKRPVVREAMIPASFWSAVQLGEINEAREARGRAPITPSTRPELREAPPKKDRKDKGANKSERGDTETPRTGVTSSHSAGGLQDTGRGDSESPNPPRGPSDGPSSSSASTPVEPPAAAAEPAPKTTKKTPEQIVQERLDGVTEDEARAVADYVAQQGDAHGNRIRSLGWWLTNRDDRDLARDLAHVRRYAHKPGAEVCGLHKVPMAGDCSSCMGDIHAGDTETVRAHLAQVGADARPDLAAVLGAPEAPAGEWTWEAQMKAERRARNGYVGGTRAPLPSREEYAELATLTQDQLRDVLMGDAPPPSRAPHGPVSRRQQESDDLFDRAMERARQREAAEAGS